jgi:hypothetical protein
VSTQAKIKPPKRQQAAHYMSASIGEQIYDSRARSLADTIEGMIDAKLDFALKPAKTPDDAKRMTALIAEARADLIQQLSGIL